MDDLEKPSLRDRLRPLELLVLSGVIAVFTGLVILFTTREWWLAAIGAGVAFILAVMTIALLALSAKPNPEDRFDGDGPDGGERSASDGERSPH